LELTLEELKELSYYEILGNLPLHATHHQIKKAYHKASLRYHPDKTGRGREDELFLQVKAAFDVLGDTTKRLAYDSTLPFDDSIPRGHEPPQDFYLIYGPVFERNLRFDARLHPERRKKSNRRHGKSKGKIPPPPSLGNDDTPIQDVHAFYEYWIHFDSWRDFTRKAQEETDKEFGNPDDADSRFEKRWIQKEIDKRARSWKRDEVSRISTLVERAMASDPRLMREKQRQQEEKYRLAEERRKAQELERQEKEKERTRVEKEAADREAAEKQARATAKAQKEREKKTLRKAKQLFRKLCIAAAAEHNTSIWKNMEAMHEEVEFLCEHLTAMQLTELADRLGGSDALPEEGKKGTKALNVDALHEVHERVQQVREGKSTQQTEAEREKQRAREADAEKARKAKAARASQPFTKEELSALAKAVKKYPPGGANRWDTIALFVNNLCKPTTPRSKEECIEKYNQIASGSKPASNSNSNSNSSKPNPTGGNPDADQWTEEQDRQLQDGLAKYPATMDKNERWNNITKGVTGKTKKECVQRFKAIREALRQKK